MASYGGAAIFGASVKIQHVPRASAQAISSFFGISGTQMMWGGSRGRAFMVSGVLMGSDVASLAAAEATLLSYDDGIGRVLTDTWGRSWPSVVFTGQYQPDPGGPRLLIDDAGWGLPYKCTFASML